MHFVKSLRQVPVQLLPPCSKDQQLSFTESDQQTVQRYSPYHGWVKKIALLMETVLTSQVPCHTTLGCSEMRNTKSNRICLTLKNKK